MSQKNNTNSFLSLLGTRQPNIEETREEHVNTARYLRGSTASRRKHEMEAQLKNLLNINDFYTAPNLGSKRSSIASRALFTNKAVKASNQRAFDEWN